MTKYVVQSGGIRNQPELKRQFHEEIVKGLGKNPKFVLCNFAQGREYWEAKFPGYAASIKEDMPGGVEPTFVLAIPDEFVRQCRDADVTYFHGGDDHLVQYWMKQFDMPAIFTDKVIATNSASSNMLAKYYWTCDWRECGEGFGILPIKLIPHYESAFGADDPRRPIDWQQAKNELENYGGAELRMYALKEGEYEVFEV